MSKLYEEKVNNQKDELLEIILTKEYKYKYSKKIFFLKIHKVDLTLLKVMKLGEKHHLV